MSLRHKLIRWLSFGDMVILNAEFLSDGTMRTREAGGNVVSNLYVSSRQDIGLGFGLRPPRAALMIESTPSQHLQLIDIEINFSKPRRALEGQP